MSIRLQVLTLTDATPPIGKILPFSTFEPMMPLKLGSLDGPPPPGHPGAALLAGTPSQWKRKLSFFAKILSSPKKGHLSIKLQSMYL